MADIITANYKGFPVVAAYDGGKMEYLSVVRESEVDNIYLCKVDHIVKNIDGAFIRYKQDEIGYVQLKKLCPSCVTNRPFSEDDNLRQGDEVILQLEAEAVKMKKPSLTGCLSVSGKYSVVSLGKKGVGASKKLSDDMRSILINIVNEKYPDLCEKYQELFYGDTFGIIVRTEAWFLYESTHHQIIDSEDEQLVEDDGHTSKIYESGKSEVEKSDTGNLYSDMFEKDFYSLIFKDIEECILKLASILKDGRNRTVYSTLYSNDSDSENTHIDSAKRFLLSNGINDIQIKDDTVLYSVSNDIDDLLKNKVWLKSGGFIVIEQLESFNAIDVNTGKAIKGKGDIAEKINFEAAKEIIRQIRLRNLTGMILIDFINMDDKDKEDKLISYVKDKIKLDPVHTSFIDITGLGIMELTRNKNDRSLKEMISQS